MLLAVHGYMEVCSVEMEPTFLHLELGVEGV